MAISKDQQARLFRDPVFRRARFSRGLTRLVIEWSNLESFLLTLLSKLLRSDMHRADIVFYAISAPAKRDMLWRLFVVFVADKKAVADFTNFLARFKRLTTTRNKYVHAVYHFGDDPSEDYLNSVRFPTDFDGSESYIEAQWIDNKRVAELESAADACAKLSTELQALTERVEPLVQATPVVPLRMLASTGRRKQNRPPRQKRPSPAARRKASLASRKS